MPKQKTHKGLAKRVKVTARGKVTHKRAGSGHLMKSKNAKRRRRLATSATLTLKPSIKAVIRKLGH
jgi:large subunit ribosomal protein L35